MDAGWGLFVGAVGQNSPHAHHALQLVLASAPQPVWLAGAWQTLPAGLLIGADVPHALGGGGVPLSLLYVEPHSATGRQLAGTLQGGWRALTAAETHSAAMALQAAEPLPALAAALGLPSVVAPADPLIAQLIQRWAGQLPEQVAAAALAAEAGLSVSRLQHRFRAHTGMALRPWLRWRRLLLALAALRQGRSATEAAHAGGFADAAHCTRTLRRHFGITPRELLA